MKSGLFSLYDYANSMISLDWTIAFAVIQYLVIEEMLLPCLTLLHQNSDFSTTYNIIMI